MATETFGKICNEFQGTKIVADCEDYPEKVHLIKSVTFLYDTFIVIPVVGYLYESAGPNICWYSQLPKKIAIVYVGR